LFDAKHYVFITKQINSTYNLNITFAKVDVSQRLPAPQDHTDTLSDCPDKSKISYLKLFDATARPAMFDPMFETCVVQLEQVQREAARHKKRVSARRWHSMPNRMFASSSHRTW
jgi:hypothetical protein